MASEKEPPPTPKSKLETLAREDLIRFAKKQAISCKQLREKNEQLEQKLKELSAAVLPVSTGQFCHSSVQTEVTSEAKEECQWLRMACTTKENVEQSVDSGGSSVDVSCQTDDQMEQIVQPTVVQMEVECQTDGPAPVPVPVPAPAPPPAPQSNPDALQEAKSQMRLLAEELDAARRELSNQSLLKLEMEDTERGFAKLQSELRQNIALLNAAQKENATLNQEVGMLQKRVSNMENEREEMRKKLAESETMVERMKTEDGASKIEMKRIQMKLEHVESELDKMKLDTATDASSMERKLCKLQATLDEMRTRLEKSENDRIMAEKQLEELNNEYKAYRTRVHSVLKQERKTAIPTSMDTEESNSIDQHRNADQQLINSLREQLEKSKQLYESCRCDLERVREQHDQLYERHRMLRVHTDEVEAQWKFELESMRSDAARVARLHAEQVRTLTGDKRDLQRDYERRMEEVMGERRERLSILEQRVAELEDELAWAKQQLVECERKGNKNGKEIETRDETMGRQRASVGMMEFTGAHRPMMERKPGEGAESVDTIQKPLLVSTMSRGETLELQRSLEDLLGDQQSVRSFDTSVDRPLKDEESSKLAKLRHLTELLSESEATNSRLTEQIKFLKDEIRRLERNTERSEHVANAEYLKNVVIQFLNPTMRDRRERLFPVLTTLLRLSPEEVTTLKQATIDNDGPPSNTPTASGWSGYIHRWSGLN